MGSSSDVPLNRLAGGVFLVTLGSLLAELSLTRVFSVLLWYHFAFLVISLALVGLSAGAASVFVAPRLSHRGPAAFRLAASSLIGGLTTAGLMVLLLRFRMTEQVSAGMLVRIVAVCVLSAVPFYFIGVVTSLAVREAGTRVSVVYAADLFGAAVGCVAFVPLVNVLGAPLTMFAAGAACGLASAAFGIPADRRGLRVLHLAMVVALIVLGPFARRAGVLTIDYAKGRPRHDLVERWNSFSRIAVWKHPSGEPFTRGISDKWDRPIPIEKFIIDIDAGANTPILEAPADPQKLDYLRHDLTSLPFALVDPAETLVIGPGGGRDVVLALLFGAKKVTAAEINREVVNVVRNDFGGFSGHLYDRNDVELVVSDGRSFILNDRRQYDVIMLSLVDTFAASAAGAMSLTENLLYTREAFEAYLRHLKPGGVLALTRWLWTPERETVRIVTLGREALEALGAEEPERHFVVASHSNLGSVLISRSPLTDGQISRARERIEALAFSPLYLPGGPGAEPFIQAATTRDLAGFCAGYPFDIGAPTDNRPFFFFTLRLGDLLRVLSMPEGRAQNLGVLIVVVVALAVLGMTVAFILVPLWLLRGDVLRERRLPLVPFVLYFCGLGVGFMLLEIPLLQKFILFFGQPSASLSVVLFSMLAGGGLGSFWTRRWPGPGTARRLVGAGLAAALILAGLTAVSHEQLGWFAGWPFAAKAMLAGAAILPLGVCLGTFFPSGVRAIVGVDENLVPWAVGLNAVASVLGSVLAMIIGIAAGFREALLVGLAVYVVVIVSFFVLRGGSVPARTC
ncbi:MAG: hypothetical protein HY718_09095 [Planctomycetes bacterium]|nr:hypothetical protein [Planctomycetota bacterium]